MENWGSGSRESLAALRDIELSESYAGGSWTSRAAPPVGCYILLANPGWAVVAYSPTISIYLYIVFFSLHNLLTALLYLVSSPCCVFALLPPWVSFLSSAIAGGVSLCPLLQRLRRLLCDSLLSSSPLRYS